VIATGGDNATSVDILSMRANHLRAQAAALALESTRRPAEHAQPGVIATAMSRVEVESATGAHMTQMLDACGIGRTGTPGEIAFLAGPESMYITGSDILIDGG
jgi:NAD(P)-dependent dehydrogenase (short-subunit alcohol dehydrogenase family)